MSARSLEGIPAPTSALDTHERECSMWTECPHRGHADDPSIRYRKPLRIEEPSRRGVRAAATGNLATCSKLDNGTRTDVLQTGHRASARHVHPIVGGVCAQGG